MTDSSKSDLWAITAYFNPSRYRSRLRNYRAFREQLRVPLVTVEIGRESSFQLDSNDADQLIQISSHDVLWQKERGLNIALEAVPNDCKNIARLDCDVVFESADWPMETCRLLERYPMVQVFSTAFDQPQNCIPGQADFPSLQNPWQSFAANWQLENDTELLRRRASATDKRSRLAMGLGWAFRRELHEDLPVYDACILGGGEHAMLCAACGCPDVVADYQCMNASQRECYFDWATKFRERTKGRLASVPGRAFHLWHGEISQRGYGSRYSDFANFNFTPGDDLVLDENKCWKWNSDKTDMHQYVRQYFNSRCEDG